MSSRLLAGLCIVLLLAAPGCARSGAGGEGDTGAAADTAAAPDRRALAFVEFADSLGRADLDWLRSKGFEVVRTFPETNSATVRVPSDYRGDPMRDNPRIIRFDVQMR